MKIPIHSAALPVIALLPSLSTGFRAPTGTGSSCSSSFTRTTALPMTRARARPSSGTFGARRGNIVMYDESNPKQPSDGSTKTDIVWSSLASTERWIQKVMDGGSGQAGASAAPTLSRKEVSYVCETSDQVEEIVAGIFRRLREMREIGVGHGAAEEELQKALGPSYRPHTFRQTLVVVAPSCNTFSSSFADFDGVVQAINQARRNARDYVTDASLDKLEEEGGGDAWDNEWITSVNLAHLHPTFGMADNALFFAEEGERDDEDPEFRAYQEKKMESRRSPFPSLVIEVRSVPPMVEEGKASAQEDANAPGKTPPTEDETVTKDDVKKLEALFGKPAVDTSPEEKKDEPRKKNKNSDEDFYDALGKSFGTDQVTFLSPVDLGQKWVAEHDHFHDEDTSSFTAFDTKYVDAAYEFVFSSIAMQLNRELEATKDVKPGPDFLWKRDYLIMPNFLTKAATSFEKFAGQVQNIINALPVTGEYLSVGTFHPEHVDRDNRSPVPILVLEWKIGT